MHLLLYVIFLVVREKYPGERDSQFIIHIRINKLLLIDNGICIIDNHINILRTLVTS